MVDKPLIRSINHPKLKDINKVKENSARSFGDKNPDKTFYVIRVNFGGGIFSILLYVLHQIKIAKNLDAIPIIDMENFPTKYNQLNKIKKTSNSWLYYFNEFSEYNLHEIYESNLL